MPKANRITVKTIEKMTEQLSISASGDDIFLSLLDEDDLTTVSKQLQTELAEQDDFQQLQAQMQDTVLSLADYLGAVQMVITETFAHSVWVQAEIRSLSSKGGHYYFELADKDEAGKITASCRANLWRGQATKLLAKFEKATGMALERGLNVLLKVTATFHPQYGFSVNISDIDPTYTLGDLAKQYQLMLTKLMEEGLLDLNKSLAMPFDIQHVLVIAPENAAGLGDFRADADKLNQTGACHFYYEHATFQGNHAPAEIREAMLRGVKSLATQAITPDIIVIIRGGGAVGDLAYLNDYELAALVAEQPYPVWVGIGHERDHVILDDVAHISFDTPSKVIAGIRHHLVTVTQSAKQLFVEIEKVANNQLALAERDSEQQFMHIESLANQQIMQAKHASHQQLVMVKQQSFYQIEQAKQRTEQLRALILLQHPKNVLAKGYAVVRDKHGKIVTSVEDLKLNQQINIELKDGSFNAVTHQFIDVKG